MIQPVRCVTLGKVTRDGVTKYRVFHYTLQYGQYVYTGMNEFSNDQTRQSFITRSNLEVVDRDLIT